MGLESCTMALLQLGLQRRRFMPWTPLRCGQRLCWVGEESKGFSQRKGSALKGMIWRFLNSPSHNISGFFSSHSLIISLLSGDFPLGMFFPLPCLFPVIAHRPHPNLCALTLAL